MGSTRSFMDGAMKEVSKAYFRTLNDILAATDGEFWPTRNNGDADIPERNLTDAVARSFAQRKFIQFFEVGSIVEKRKGSSGNVDVVFVSPRRLVLCEAKLLYSGNGQAKSMLDDVNRLAAVGESKITEQGLRRPSIVRMVVATTWTSRPAEPGGSTKHPKKRQAIVKCWGTKGRLRFDDGLKKDSNFVRLIRRLQKLRARRDVHSSPRELTYEGKVWRSHVLTAYW
jgi:hypothetical protein